MLRGTSEYIQFISKEVLARLIESCSLNIYIPTALVRRKPSKSRTDPEEWRRKQWKETPQTSRGKKVFISRKKRR